jgi:hypothetical protein
VRIACLSRTLSATALLYTAASLLCPAVASALGLLYVVNSTSDVGHDPATGDGFCETAIGNGVCTLRAAIEETNGHPGTDGIRFNIPTTDPGYNAQTRVYTIKVSSVLPNLSDSVNITGPGATSLTVQRDVGGFRIFNVTTTGAVNFSGLTIALGYAGDYGGAIQNVSSGMVTISNCTLRNNYAFTAGGAVANSSTGTLSINNSTLNDKGAPGGGRDPNCDRQAQRYSHHHTH